MNPTALRIAVVGAGPVGLALALQAARTLPQAELCVFDARPPGRDIGADPRTLALSLGSVMLLRRLLPTLPPAEPILEVHVSQQAPGFGQPALRISAADEGVSQLGAVLSYGALVAPLQQAWLDAVAAEPARLRLRLGTPVAALKQGPEGVEVDAQVVETFDLVVVAEGGLFGEQPRKALRRDYGQTAWVGSVSLEGAARGLAVERFTDQGPAALLPLAPGRAALVWCVASADDAVPGLDDGARLARLAAIFPHEAGRLTGLSALAPFTLGLNAERTLVAGRTVRIGNAAQTLHPVAGQGLNLGLRDAYALVAALRRQPDLDAALRRVEWSRARDRWSVIASTDFLARSFTWPGPVLAGARGLGLAALQALPPARHWLARQMMFGQR